MKVFISYAYADQTLANKVSKALKQAGLDVWDGTEILPGENWAEKVGEALHESQAMVVLLTPASLHSNNVKYEIGYALGDEDYSRRIIPVIATSPDKLSKEQIPWILNKFQMVRLGKPHKEEEDLKKIAQLIKEAA